MPAGPEARLAGMRYLIAFAAALFIAAPAQAQRVYTQAELDAMLAPIALHPDGLVSQILIAATYPEEIAAAASWSRTNPSFRGEEAVRLVQYEPWDPAVKALVAFPELLVRMEESPQWLHDLGQAFLTQQAHVMDTVQLLRRRAHAAGHLANTDQYAVYSQDEAIVVQPRTQIVYVRYYDPYVVYGPWWWPHYRPVYWRPWAVRPVFVSHGFFYSNFDWRHRHVRVVHRPVHVQHHQHRHVEPGRWSHQRPHVVHRPVRVPEAQRKPIVQSPRPTQHMPAANAFSQQHHPRPQPQAKQPHVKQPQAKQREQRQNRPDRGHRG
jgi:hypothetical protein